MKIAIMGTGAMACLFAGRMIQTDHEVWMVSGWKEQVEKLSADGLVLSTVGGDTVVLFPKVSLRAEDVLADGRYPDLVIIASKGYHTERTIKNALPIIGVETRVLTLQNGMGNAEIIAKYIPAHRVYFGGASIAADLKSLGEVHDATLHNRSPLVGLLSLTQQEDEWAIRIGELFDSLGYSAAVGPAGERFVWKKLCLNCCCNALAGVTQFANYVFPSDPDGNILLDKICAESVRIAQAKGIPLNYDEIRAFIQKTFTNQHHYASMCQDMHNKRPTEIESINGYIVREGHRLDIPTPVNETLFHMVRMISAHYSEQWI